MKLSKMLRVITVEEAVSMQNFQINVCPIEEGRGPCMGETLFCF